MVGHFQEVLHRSMYVPAMVAMAVLCAIAIVAALAARDVRAAKVFTVMTLLFVGIAGWLQAPPINAIGMAITVSAAVLLLYLLVSGWLYDRMSSR